MQRVLMVVTSHDRIDAEHRTGLWLEEFAVPYNLFREAGLEVAVASPRRGATPIDPNSTPAPGLASAWVEAEERLANTEPLDQFTADGFDAVFLPGGHGTMFDLPDNVRLQQIIRELALAGKVVGAVCHGPAGLVNVRGEGDAPLVAGRTLTAFTDAEEAEVRLTEKMPFLLESTLRARGANVATRGNWEDHTVVDGNLVTGQNPQSSASAGAAVVALLQDTRARMAA